MREAWAVQLVRGAHHFFAEGRRGILDQRDVIAKLHREAAGGFDAGVGQQADHNHLDNLLPLQPEIQVGVRKAASGGLLVEADDVSCRVAEPRSDLGRVRADRLHELASVGDDRVKGGGHAVNHDVNEKAGL